MRRVWYYVEHSAVFRKYDDYANKLLLQKE